MKIRYSAVNDVNFANVHGCYCPWLDSCIFGIDPTFTKCLSSLVMTLRWEMHATPEEQSCCTIFFGS